MAPPPGRRAIRPLLRAGDLLADRYRLEHPVEPAPRANEDEESPAIVWRAQDEVLARPVAVKVLRAAGRRGAVAARPFLEAAAAAASLSSPLLARVYDAAIQEWPAERAGRPAGEVDVAYVISEWVDGRDLAEVLREDGPFEPEQACALVVQAAEALQSAHDRGVWHARVHPGNVMVTPAGRLTLTDTATSAALPDRAVPAARAGDPVGAAADVRDLTAVLYAMLTARWPVSATPQPSCGVPAAPATRDRKRGRISSPRQVRAGVPSALDALVVRVLQPTPGRAAPTSAAALADAFVGAVRADAPRPVAPREPRIPPWVRRFLPVLASLAFIGAVGLGAYAVGRDLGEIPPLDAPPSERALAPAAGAPAAGARIDLATATLDDFDPLGGGGERPGSLPNAVDEDPTTVWETERYGSAAFGGLKSGVGLLVDLGKPTRVGRVELLTTGGGAAFELRAADALGARPEDYRVVASGRAAEEQLVLTPAAGTTARFYLVWITGLSQSEDGFRAGIKELSFRSG
ncbi:MAG: serine/threonine protein kinase [Frankiales bacterium]|nr:serine/threonine protein kinase [Frankiales bacterium]